MRDEEDKVGPHAPHGPRTQQRKGPREGPREGPRGAGRPRPGEAPGAQPDAAPGVGAEASPSTAGGVGPEAPGEPVALPGLRGASFEATRLVVYALLRPAVRLAYAARIPSKELTRWVQVAYFHETRRQGLKMREATDRLDLSMRKVAQLSKQLKESFLRPEQEHALPRRVEYMLWSGPLSARRIKQALPDVEPEDVDAALEEMLEQGRVVLQAGRTPRYAVPRSAFRLVEDGLFARVDGLQVLLDNLADTVFARLFDAPTYAPRSFARTVGFRVLARSAHKLRELYDEVLWPRLKELDDEAHAAAAGEGGERGGGEAGEEFQELSLSVFWAPHELLPRLLRREVAATRAAAAAAADEGEPERQREQPEGGTS